MRKSKQPPTTLVRDLQGAARHRFAMLERVWSGGFAEA